MVCHALSFPFSDVRLLSLDGCLSPLNAENHVMISLHSLQFTVILSNESTVQAESWDWNMHALFTRILYIL